jgi:hypothetical protein
MAKKISHKIKYLEVHCSQGEGNQVQKQKKTTKNVQKINEKCAKTLRINRQSFCSEGNIKNIKTE